VIIGMGLSPGIGLSPGMGLRYLIRKKKNFVWILVSGSDRIGVREWFPYRMELVKRKMIMNSSKNVVNYDCSSIQSEIGLKRENCLDSTIAPEIYYATNTVCTIDNNKTRYKKWTKNIPQTPTNPIQYRETNNIGKYVVPLCLGDTNLPKKPTNPVTLKEDWEYSNYILSHYGQYLTRHEKWDLFYDLFEAFPINPEKILDERVSFIIRYIGKVRLGIKSKVKCQVTKKGQHKKLTKSKGYNTQRIEKDIETSLDSFQMAYYNCYLNKKYKENILKKYGKHLTKNEYSMLESELNIRFKSELTPLRVILSALKTMTQEKKFNRKIDIMGWKLYRSEVVEQYHHFKQTTDKEDKLEQLKTKLANYVPKTKLEKQWSTVWTLFICENMKRKDIALNIGTSKQYVNRIMKEVPLEFKDYKNELISCCSIYYKK
jgi:hypothetical protein